MPLSGNFFFRRCPEKAKPAAAGVAKPRVLVSSATGFPP
jgi:hypothetical protein